MLKLAIPIKYTTIRGVTFKMLRVEEGGWRPIVDRKINYKKELLNALIDAGAVIYIPSSRKSKGQYIKFSKDFYFCPRLEEITNRSGAATIMPDVSIRYVSYEEASMIPITDASYNASFIYNMDTAIKLGFKPSLHDKFWYSPKEQEKNNIKIRISQPAPIVDYGFGSQPHEADSGNKLFVSTSELWKTLPYPKVDKVYLQQLKAIEKVLTGLTYGIEYETSAGGPNFNLATYSGLVPLRDGSLPPGAWEWATVVMGGENIKDVRKGLYKIKDQCKVLSASSSVNMNCALHVHMKFGSSKEILTATYMLFTHLQGEIYRALPWYKLDDKVLGKEKAYSAPIGDLLAIHKKRNITNAKEKKEFVDKAFGHLFEYVSTGKKLGKEWNRKLRVTPWQHKWNCATRYQGLNIVPFFFNQAGTIEFRFHEPTLNFTKVSNFITTCAAIIKYAEANVVKIFNGSEERITLKEVIDFSFPVKEDQTPNQNDTNLRLRTYLNNYWSNRGQEYSNQATAAQKYAEEKTKDPTAGHPKPFFNTYLTEKLIKDLAEDSRYKFICPDTGISVLY